MILNEGRMLNLLSDTRIQWSTEGELASRCMQLTYLDWCPYMRHDESSYFVDLINVFFSSFFVSFLHFCFLWFILNRWLLRFNVQNYNRRRMGVGLVARD